MARRRKKMRKEKEEKGEVSSERSEKEELRITRRNFLKGLAAATATALAAGRLDALNFPKRLESGIIHDLIGSAPPSVSVSFVRPEDFTALRFDFFGFNLNPGSALTNPVTEAQLVPVPQPPTVEALPLSFIVMHLPPQSIAEQAFFEASEKTDPNCLHQFVASDGTVTCLQPLDSTMPGYEVPGPSEQPPSPGLVQSHLAGWSRLVFRYTKTNPIPYTVHDILNTIMQCDLQVAPVALSHIPPTDLGLPQISDPNLLAPSVTAVESPYRLIISPHDKARWAHSRSPVSQIMADGTSLAELWHTRLAVAGVPSPDGTRGPDETSAFDAVNEGLGRVIRAIWASQAAPQGGAPDFYTDPYNLLPGQPSPSPQNPYVVSPITQLLEFGPTHHVSLGINNNGPPFFRTSLDNRDRDEIVHLSSNFQISQYVPQAVPVNRLMLSSLGSWMDLDGVWDPPAHLAIEKWRHIAAMGRDSYVKVVYSGHLKPSRHRASLIKVTERRFVQSGAATAGGAPLGVVAYLKQRMYIVVREPEIQYPVVDHLSTGDQGAQPWNGRRSPFQRLRITTVVTPNIDDPSNAQVTGFNLGQDAFWVEVGGSPFQFHFVGTDWDGNTSEFTLPMVFIDTSVSPEDYNGLVMAYNQGYLDRRTTDMGGQLVAFAPSASSGKPTGTTSYGADSITWTAEYVDPHKIPLDEVAPPPTGLMQTDLARQLVDEKAAPFYPAAESAMVRLAAVSQLTATDPDSTKSEIQYYGGLDINSKGFGYLWNGFGPAQIFAQLPDPQPKGAPRPSIDFGSNVQKSGGLAAPSLKIAGLSASLGTVGSLSGTLDSLASGTFDPTDALLGGAKILGAISLSNVIAMNIPEVGDGKASPKITTTIQRDPNTGDPTALIVNLHWEPTKNGQPAIHSWDPTSSSLPSNPLFDVDSLNPPKLTLDATLTKPLSGDGMPTYIIDAKIEKPNNSDQAFAINLLPGGDGYALIKVPIVRMGFRAESGGKTDVSAVLGVVQFEGILEFVNTIEEILSALGFDDPPFVDITSTGITTGFEVGLPQVPIGAIILSNLKLSARLNLPFTGEQARLRFAISERENPFTITFTVFGGGGFFGIALGLDNMELLEGSLEFGAYISLDLGVASGGAHAAAGIYFKIENDPDMSNKNHERAELSGYCRIGGALEVLGIVAVNTEFYLDLTYDSDQKTVTGQASLTVEVEVAFFHQSVTLGPITKTFGHSPDPPTFGDVISAGGWANYVNKFAELVA